MNSKPSVNLSATYLGQDKTSSYKPTGYGPRTFFSTHGDVQYVHTLLTNYDTCIDALTGFSTLNHTDRNGQVTASALQLSSS